jgi:hypothetical protein
LGDRLAAAPVWFKTHSVQLRVTPPRELARCGSETNRNPNVIDDGFRLSVAWLTAALRPVGPYPKLRMLGVFVVSSRTRARRRVLVTRVEHLGLAAELDGDDAEFASAKPKMLGKLPRHAITLVTTWFYIWD